jgi:hypothetical protein
MSRGLGVMERAVAVDIARCKKRDVRQDTAFAGAGFDLPEKTVMVTPWSVCVSLLEGPFVPPSRSQLNSAARAMHSFVRKYPQYALIARSGRGCLALYERGDELSAMWAKLRSQRESFVIRLEATDALEHVKAGRNEPFSTGGKGPKIEEGRRIRKHVYRDIDAPR